MKNLFLLFALVPTILIGQSITVNYEDGEIPTSLDSFDPACNGPSSTINIELPPGEPWQVTGFDVSYNMTAQAGGFMSHQRSLIHFQNTNTSESSVAQGSGNSGGIQPYSRSNVSIANGLYAGGTVLVFEMRAWRTDIGSGCNTTYNRVDNFTWTITVHYTDVPDDGSVGIGTTSPHASALLDLESAQKGLLPPRMSSALREAIPDPANGLVVYDTDLMALQVFNGTEWRSLETVEGSPWQANASGIHFQDGDVGIGTANPAALLQTYGTGTGEGNVLFTGELKSTVDQGDPPVEGPGTRMMWYPDKSAFRVGSVTGTRWNKGSIGRFSMAWGYDSRASGSEATAWGWITEASGWNSTAWGVGTKAFGGESTAWGRDTEALGYNTTAWGSYTRAYSFAETAIGRYNTTYTPANAFSWISSDRLFVIGNGTSDANRNDALVILKNGNLGLGHSQPTALLHAHGTGTGEGNVLFTGEYKTAANQGDPPAEGPGTRMMWYPDMAAFRVGRVTGTQWNKGSIGSYSKAWGQNTIASTFMATAWGENTTASGVRATAWGQGSEASNSNATAWGFDTHAASQLATAWGENTNAAGFRSTAWGAETEAVGSNSTAWGRNTTAYSFVETAIGRYNTAYTPVGSTFWSSSDRLFVIGNGTSNSSRSDAFMVLKNGNTGIGVSNPAHRLTVLSTTGLTPNGTGIGIVTTVNTNYWNLHMTSAFFRFSYNNENVSYINNNTGEYVMTSDARLKENIKKTANMLDRVRQLNVVSYNYKRDLTGSRTIGLLAQDTKGLFPELVHQEDETDFYGISYTGLSVVAIKAIQEQQNIIESQQETIQSNQDLIQDLISRIEYLENPN